MTKEESIKKQTEETTSFWLKVIAISGSFLFLLLTAVSYFTWDGNFINGMIINISAALALYGIYLLAGIYPTFCTLSHYSHSVRHSD